MMNTEDSVFLEQASTSSSRRPRRARSWLHSFLAPWSGISENRRLHCLLLIPTAYIVFVIGTINILVWIQVMKGFGISVSAWAVNNALFNHHCCMPAVDG